MFSGSSIISTLAATCSLIRRGRVCLVQDLLRVREPGLTRSRRVLFPQAYTQITMLGITDNQLLSVGSVWGAVSFKDDHLFELDTRIVEQLPSNQASARVKGGVDSGRVWNSRCNI